MKSNALSRMRATRSSSSIYLKTVSYIGLAIFTNMVVMVLMIVLQSYEKQETFQNYPTSFFIPKPRPEAVHTWRSAEKHIKILIFLLLLLIL